MSIFFADIPDRYCTGVTGQGAAQTNIKDGYKALGSLLSKECELWSGRWTDVDAWFISQVETSYLRTYDAHAADIIFVPAILDINDLEQQHSLVENAFSLFPYFQKKAHVVVLTHTPGTYNGSDLLTHKNSRGFIFLSWGLMDASGSSAEPPHVLGIPAFSHVHWSRGSKSMQQQSRMFNASAVLELKDSFAATSFVVRSYGDRFRTHEQCLQRPDKCTYYGFNGPEDAARVFWAFKKSWLVLHPQGDFVARNSYFDTWLADAIVVVFQPECFDAVPFADLIDYNRLMVLVPEEQFAPGRGNLVDLLAERFDEQEALAKIKAIHEVQHIFQYSLNPDHGEMRWSQMGALAPGDDALTFSFKAVMRNICHFGRSWLRHRCLG